MKNIRKAKIVDIGMNKIYDLAVIGGGPGGYHAAIRAAQYGAKVALIEKNKLGGTCLNVGCIPTKALYASAEMIHRIKEHGEEFGVITDIKLDFAKAVERKNRVVEELVGGIEALEKAWKNDVYKGFGKIIGGNAEDGYEISIEGEDNAIITARRVIIATGSAPALIPAFNIDHDRILTSDDILNPNFKIVPKSLLIIGAGRSGLVGKAFAMRLMHLGFNVYVHGETIVPALAPQDLVIAISGSGRTKLVVTAAEVAKGLGAKVVAITSYIDAPLAKLADLVIRIPGRTKVSKEDDYNIRQLLGIYEPLAPLGTLFEITAMVFLDSIVTELMSKLGKSEEDLRRRHTNIE